MGRPAKDGKFVNFLLEAKLIQQLEQVVGIVGGTKTAFLENALKERIEAFYNSDGEINPVDALYVVENNPCVILDTLKVNGRKYYKIYYDGDILTVPVRNVVKK